MISTTEATVTLARFRSDHVIDPEYPRTTREPKNWCRTCGVLIYPIRNGWRHDPHDIAVISEAAR